MHDLRANESHYDKDIVKSSESKKAMQPVCCDIIMMTNTVSLLLRFFKNTVCRLKYLPASQKVTN